MFERKYGSSTSGSFNKASFNRAPREMHDTTCAECGKQCQVPFKPNGLKPVYCSDCFQKHRPARTPRRY